MATFSSNDHQYSSICSERTLQSDKNGFFLQFADHVLESAGMDWLKSKFSKLKTDRERIETLFTDNQIKNTISETLLNVQCFYRKKDAKLSREKRIEGLQIMKNGNTKKALMFLCQSVLRAPIKDLDSTVDEGRTLALAIWYRAHVLMELGHIDHALNDLQLTQKEGLPEEYKPELYARMAECYHALKDVGRAKVAAEIAKKLGMNKITIHVMKRIKDKEEPGLPNLTGGSNSDMIDASSLLTVNESRELGRYMVAKDNIKTGDTLIVEPPFVSCLLPDCFGSHCHHCFKSLLAPIGCPDCSALAFCSAECRDISLSTYHKHECKILDLLIGSGMSVLCHAALRMITQDKGRARNRQDKVYKLCSHSDKRDSKDLLRRTLMAAFLLRCLQVNGYFTNEAVKDEKEIKLSEEELTVGEMLLTNLQILQFNAHEVYETRRGPKHKFRGARAVYIGIALYPTSALLNHHCYPAVTRYFVGKNMIIRAIRPLKSGDMVAENYGPNFLKRTLPERQRNLQSRYWFKCDCQACKEDWPLLDKLENMHGRIRCPNKNCNNLFCQPARETSNCLNCKKKVNLKPSLEKLKTCEEEYKAGLIAMDSELPEKAIPLLCNAVDTFHEIASPPHRGTHLCQESLRTCMADSGNMFIIQ